MILLPLLCFGIMCACLDFFTGYTWRSDFPLRWKGNYNQLFHAGRKEQPDGDMDWSAHGIIWNNYTQFQRKKCRLADNNDYITKNCYINLYGLNIVKRNDLTAIMVCPSTLGWLVVLNPKSTCPRLWHPQSESCQCGQPAICLFQVYQMWFQPIGLWNSCRFILPKTTREAAENMWILTGRLKTKPYIPCVERPESAL